MSRFLGDRAAGPRDSRTGRGDGARPGSHPAALMFAVGNEIPPAIVRWHGTARVERFLRDLHDACKQAAPSSLITYVNFPPTEYLDLDCFDVHSFNVYLHRESRPPRPISPGCSMPPATGRSCSRRPAPTASAKGSTGRRGSQRCTSARPSRKARRARWRLPGPTSGGAAVTRWRTGRLASWTPIASPSRRWRRCPARSPGRRSRRTSRRRWPKVSVVVCAYNAADTIDDCLTSLSALTYPNAELIVVNDGSRDATGDDCPPLSEGAGDRRAQRRPERGTQHRNRACDRRDRGLHRCRRAGRSGLAHLSGAADPVGPVRRLGRAQRRARPTTTGWRSAWRVRRAARRTCCSNDRVAEHVPGCNMAFRRDALVGIGGFNPAYLRAGDDVDICWRLQARGHEIGFAPSALVWHHHRSTVKAYWRQQVGYGEGETWLDAHHPEKFVRGQMLWKGHIYSPLPFLKSLSGRRVNTGVWGTAAFPSIYSEDSLPAGIPAAFAGVDAGLAGAHRGRPARPGDCHALTCGCCCSVSSGWAITIVRCIQFALDSDLRGAAGGRGPLAGPEPAVLSGGDRVAAPHQPGGADVGTDQGHVVDAARDRRGAHHATAVEGAGPGPAATSCARSASAWGVRTRAPSGARRGWITRSC